MNNLSGKEKETVILYNESEKTAEIFTYNKALIQNLDLLCETRPADVIKYKKQQRESASYIIPKKWVKIKAPRQLTDEERVERAERMRRSLKYNTK